MNNLMDTCFVWINRVFVIEGKGWDAHIIEAASQEESLGYG